MDDKEYSDKIDRYAMHMASEVGYCIQDFVKNNPPPNLGESAKITTTNSVLFAMYKVIRTAVQNQLGFKLHDPNYLETALCELVQLVVVKEIAIDEGAPLHVAKEVAKQIILEGLEDMKRREREEE